MYGNKRKCMLLVFDYSGNIVCTLFDNYSDTVGQAQNVFISTQKNGWKELSFTIPSAIETLNGWLDNYRLLYLKADYKIRVLIDEGLDWYIISEPKITHSAFSKNVDVVAGHIAQLLKTKNMSLLLSDDNKNNVGTAKLLLTTILDGTDWSVGTVYDFGLKNGTTKKRTLNSLAHTGCFKMISDLCLLFDAKPVYYGDTRTVDILPINPFSTQDDNLMPVMSKEDSDKVFELNYGNNISSVTRTLNTLNLITKLYAYGSYGDKTYGYCGIDECKHCLYTYVTTRKISSGTTCSFKAKDLSDTVFTTYTFTATLDISVGSTLIYSYLDPASQMYIWNNKTQKAYFVNSSLTATVSLPDGTLSSVENKFAFIMDFSYYKKIGLFDNDMLQKIATYQRNAPSYFTKASLASATLSANRTLLSKISGGNINCCKLAITSIGNNNGYLQLHLDTTNYDDGVIYRTDYDLSTKNYFEWITTDSLDSNGDPINSGASMIYVIHDDGHFNKYYLKEIDDEDNPTALTFWANSSVADNWSINAHYFLFQYNGINGYLGSLLAADESDLQSLEDLTTVVTQLHPVTFTTDSDTTIKDSLKTTTYAWKWVYDESNRDNSQMYFVYPSDTSNDTTWKKVSFGSILPSSGEYFYNWKLAVLYRYNGGWNALTTDAEKKVAAYFGAVFALCRQRDRLYFGLSDVYIHYITGTEENSTNNKLPVGNYFFENPYNIYWIFTTDTLLDKNSYLAYDTLEGHMIEGISTNYTDGTFDITLQVINMKSYRFDAVKYHANDILDVSDTTRISFSAGAILTADGTFVLPTYKTTTDSNDVLSLLLNTVTIYLDSTTKLEAKASLVSRTANYVSVVPNTTYKYLGTYTLYGFCYDGKFLYIKNKAFVINPNTLFTTDSSTKYLRFVCGVTYDTINAVINSMRIYAPNKYDSNGLPLLIIIDDVPYRRLNCLLMKLNNNTYTEASSLDLIGIMNCVKKMKTLYDLVYDTNYKALINAQNATTSLLKAMTSSIGDLYRLSWWQESSYVDGDEDKLYTDAIDKLKLMAKPLTTYTIEYLDLYEANKMLLDAHEDEGYNWIDVDITSPIHLIDLSIDVNEWGFVLKINKCYDDPWKTTLLIGTNITDFYAHTIDDVIKNVTLSAIETKDKISIYDSVVLTANNVPVALITAILANAPQKSSDTYIPATSTHSTGSTTTLSGVSDSYSGVNITINNSTGGYGSSSYGYGTQLVINTYNTNGELLSGVKTRSDACYTGIFDETKNPPELRAGLQVVINNDQDLETVLTGIILNGLLKAGLKTVIDNDENITTVLTGIIGDDGKLRAGLRTVIDNNESLNTIIGKTNVIGSLSIKDGNLYVDKYISASGIGLGLKGIVSPSGSFGTAGGLDAGPAAVTLNDNGVTTSGLTVSGTSFSKKTVPIVTDFTQASKTNYTLLISSLTDETTFQPDKVGLKYIWTIDGWVNENT